MTDHVVVEVTCHHEGGGGKADLPPQTVYRVQVTPGREVRGFELSGRVVLNGGVLQGEDLRTKWRALWGAATRTGQVPRVVHQLRCSDCDSTVRVPDLDLRRALTRLAEAGVSSVELTKVPRIV